MISSYQAQVEWIQKIHTTLRSPAMDRFFIGWGYAGSFAFVMIVVALVWYLLNRKIGVKLFYIMILSGVTNMALKAAFDLPRPCQVDSSIGLICLSSPGFPSGAAQTAILFGGIAVLECRKRIYKILGILFALFLSFSRIYLGVHYFTDVFGGWIVGAILLFVYWKLFPKFERGWKIWAFLFPALLLLIERHFIHSFWAGLGVAVGLLLQSRAKDTSMPKWGIRIGQAWSVIFGAFFLLTLKRTLPAYGPIFGIGFGFWFSFLGAWLITKVHTRLSSR